MGSRGIDVEGDGNFVVAGDYIHHGPALPLPGQGRECVQCKRDTWAATRHCVHCGFDVFAYDAYVHQCSVIRRIYWLMAAIASFGLLSFLVVSPVLSKLGFPQGALFLQLAVLICLFSEWQLVGLLAEHRQLRAML